MSDGHDGVHPEHVDRAIKLLEMRDTGDHYRKVAVERKIKELSPDVHAAATARLSGSAKLKKAPARVQVAVPPSTPPPAKPTRHLPPVDTTSGRHSPVGSHMEMTTDYVESDPDLLFREYQMGRLPQKMGGTRLGWPLNEEAKILLRKFDKLGPTSESSRRLSGNLREASTLCSRVSRPSAEGPRKQQKQSRAERR
jgi:hypothetical protein